ncbi:hypothetical protein KI387_023812 [Taxus chinensis]|uniref:PHD-type domain-containing protein n=1 Tax=Taxus chinensis TaxID=29808 RepID=A0AA38LB25_TAXCH|nr:hypothetical protein KI387_023812 [Taxus chinensis]
MMTWPVYLVEYLLSQGFSKISGQKVGHLRLCDSEYYSTSVSMKLTVLEFLCNDVMETEEIRPEISTRLGDVDTDEEDILINGSIGPVKKKSMRGRPRLLKRLGDVDTDEEDNLINGSIGPVKNKSRRGRPRLPKHLGDVDTGEEDNLINGSIGPVKKKSRRGRPRLLKHHSEESVVLDCIKTDDQESSISSPRAGGNTSYTKSMVIFQGNSGYIQNKEYKVARSEANDVEKWNSDECCLCRMDGALICCDGCPAAYHSRCVGVSKDALPEGDWYCPECLVRKGPRGLAAVKGLHGAEFLGIDPHGRIYFSICGYLLVSDSALDPGTTFKYYNRNDSTKVLDLLDSSTPLYDIIHNALLQCWDKGNTMVKSGTCLDKTDTVFEKCTSESSIISVLNSLVHQEQENISLHPSVTYQDNTITKNAPFLKGRPVKYFDVQGRKEDIEMMDVDQGNGDAQIASSESSLKMTPLNVDAQALKKNCEQKFTDSDAPCFVEYTKNSLLQGQQLIEVDAGNSAFQMEQPPQQSDICTVCMPGQTDLVDIPPKSFQLNTYVNQYVLGDVAASAAANLAVKGAENKKINVERSSKRCSSAAITEQMKITEQMQAFSKAAAQFSWPCFTKKCVEVQKEKCGWCLLCKSYTSNIRGCLLHMASEKAAGALGGAGDVCPSKNGDGNFPEIVAYMLYMENQLYGLLDGPWENPSYRKIWHRYIEQASSIAEVKHSLLELELNIKPIALSADWCKAVDDASTGVSTSQFNASVASPTPKRGRPRKYSADAKTSSVVVETRTFGVNWWRGCKLSGQPYYQNFLPHIIARRAGRQAGFRKLPGIFYAEGLEIPRRCKRYAWRAAVEMSRNVSQLALQVRILNACIRWDDLANSEDFPRSKWVEEKGTTGYKKAAICAKSSEKGLVKYLVDFGKQKDIPNHIVKHGIKLEDAEEGKNKYWISENYVPLFLLKAFRRKPMRGRPKKNANQFPKLPVRLPKNSNLDVFSFLLAKAEGRDKFSCAHCKMDVPIWKAVQCQICEGSFHCKCMIPSFISGSTKCKFTCHKCHDIKLLERDPKVHSKKIGVSIHKFSRLAKEPEELGISSLDAKQNKYKRRRSHNENVAELKINSVTKSGVCKIEGAVRSDGLLWKTNGTDELGKEYRKSRLLLPCESSMEASTSPVCFLCYETYNCQLIYVGCESCTEWFHGDAFGLTTENIVDLLAFKCHKCRKKARPACPYAKKNLQTKKPDMKIKTDNGEMLAATENRKPSSAVYSRQRTVSSEEPHVMLVSRDVHAETKMICKSEYGPVSDAKNIINAAPIPVYQEPITPKINCDSSIKDYLREEVTNWPQNREEDALREAFLGSEMGSNDADFSYKDFLQEEVTNCRQHRKGDELRETYVGSEMKNNGIVQTCPGIQTQSMLSYTELLASEDDKVENLFDLSREGGHNWSANLLLVNEAVNGSQVHNLVNGSNLSSGASVPSNNSEKVQDQFTNTFSREKFVHQTYRKESKIILDEIKMEKCANCDLREVAPDLQCGVCGTSIHFHCYKLAPAGLWTECGWLCGCCEAGFVRM